VIDELPEMIGWVKGVWEDRDVELRLKSATLLLKTCAQFAMTGNNPSK
jgi:hypothetical protein